MSAVLVTDAKTLSAKQIAFKWHTTSDKVRLWCKEGFIAGAKKSESFPFQWTIPSSANRPIDDLLLREMLRQVVELQNRLIAQIDLTDWGIPLEDTYFCIEALAESGYLKVIEGSVIAFTRRGISTLCRVTSPEENKAVPPVLIWAAEVGGVFAGSAVKQFI